MKNALSGISAVNTERIKNLHRSVKGPFSIREAMKILKLPYSKTSFLLSYLAKRSWLNRINRGLYIAVPLDASVPSEWSEDPWIVAMSLFSPCYIGGWSACEHWGLTEQIFRDIVCVTGKPIRNFSPVIQKTKFRLKKVSPDRLFGLKTVWRRSVKIQVSDTARTIIDIIDDPSLGGGIRHVAEILAAYFSDLPAEASAQAGNNKTDHQLLDYIEKFGNRTIYKRLGYLLEILKIDRSDLVNECFNRKSSGYSYLDPGIKKKGKITRRWNLLINASIRIEEVYR